MSKYTPEEILENIKQANVYYQQIVMHMMQNKSSDMAMSFIDKDKNAEIAKQIYNQFTKNPEKFAKINLDYVNQFQKLVIDSLGKFAGHKVEQEEGGQNYEDRRFKDPAWQQNAYFDFIRQFYQLNAKWAETNIKEMELDAERKNYVEFFAKQFIDALSPSNFVFSNPEVIRESLESGMKNIVSGMHNFLEDIKNQNGIFNISTTDKKKFRIGKNLAVTKGKVIYQNDLMQLICYEPKDKTYAVPLLIIPPWINKYYILDLSQNNSMVNWLVENNYQVFLISWVNPGKDLANKDFEDYMQEGIIEAFNQMQQLGYKKINAVGYCIGGTLLASTLSYLKSTKNEFINSASFLTTLVDFSQPGDIGAFINQGTLDIVKKEVTEKGYLDGKYISNSFGLIRANDLVWSFFVNNYLLGKSPAAFDILYWNAEPTNLPAKMYIYYIKNMYLENKMIKPEGITLSGQKIDITKIDLPTFSLAAKRDHIALWQGVYNGYRLFSGKRTFCLTDAGHVAGVVNPADNTKYSHHISDNIVDSFDEWLNQSELRNGSWWNSWNTWLQEQSGVLQKAINYRGIKELEPAPGRYVMQAQDF